MKRTRILVLSLILTAIGLGVTACVAEVGGPGPGYYHGGPWYHDGPWMGGPRGYVGVGVHPGRW